MTKEQGEAVKRGEIPQEWQKEEKANKLRQTDLDARVGVKYHTRHIGYKMHNKVDAESKCVVDVIVTPANVADAKVIGELVNETDKVIYADKGYYGKKVAEQLPATVKNEIHERANRNHPLSAEAKERNRGRSGIRCLVEHVFGTMKCNMKCGVLRCVGAARAKMQILLLCLTYNMKRLAFLQRCEQF